MENHILVSRPFIKSFTLIDENLIQLEISYFNQGYLEFLFLNINFELLLSVLLYEHAEIYRCVKDALSMLSNIQPMFQPSLPMEISFDCPRFYPLLVSKSDWICCLIEVDDKNNEVYYLKEFTVDNWFPLLGKNSEIRKMKKNFLVLFNEYCKVSTIVLKGIDIDVALDLYKLNIPYIRNMLVDQLELAEMNNLYENNESENDDLDEM